MAIKSIICPHHQYKSEREKGTFSFKQINSTKINFIMTSHYNVVTCLWSHTFAKGKRHLAQNQMSAQREHNKNVIAVVTIISTTQRKIVSNIFKSNIITHM